MQQECECTNSEQEINVPEHDIAVIKVELHDESRMVEDIHIGSFVDENPLMPPFETNITPSVSNHTQVDRELKATKKQKKSIKNDNSSGKNNEKYDCYLCNKR